MEQEDSTQQIIMIAAAAAFTTITVAATAACCIARSNPEACCGRRREEPDDFEINEKKKIDAEVRRLESEIAKTKSQIKAHMSKAAADADAATDTSVVQKEKTTKLRKRHRKKNPEKKKRREMKKRAAAAKASGNASSASGKSDPVSTKTSESKSGEPDNDGWTTQTYKKKKKRRQPQSLDDDKKSSTGGVHASSTASSKPANDDASVTDYIKVPSRKIGSIIGKQGVTLHALQDKTGTKIDTPSRKVESEETKRRKGEIPALRHRDEMVTVTIRGPPKGVKDVKYNIQSLVTKGYCRLLNPEMKEGFMRVPASSIGPSIIGTGGNILKKLQEATHTKINLPSQSERASSKPNDMVRVHMTGEKHNIRVLKDHIKSLLKYHWSEVTHPGQVYQEVAVAQNQVRKVIGYKGQTIKNIQSATKTKIHTPSSSSENSNVIVVGTKANVERALARIKEAVEAVNEPAGDYDDDEEEDEDGY